MYQWPEDLPTLVIKAQKFWLTVKSNTRGFSALLDLET